VLGFLDVARAYKKVVEQKGALLRSGRATDRELDALRNYIRSRARLVTRPNGVAPPEPEAPPPPVETATPEEPKEQPPAPGSLEPAAPPPKL